MPSTYSVDHFVQDIRDLQSQGLSDNEILQRGSSFLERLIANPNCIPPEYRVPCSKGPNTNHGNYLLYKSPSLLLSAEVWGPGEYIGPHDHHVWGMIGVIENTLNETRFRKLDDGSDPGWCELEKTRTVLSKPGEVSLLIPEIDEIHQIDNSTNTPTVEIHVYGQDLATIERCRFNPETGAVTSFGDSKRIYDNE